MRSSNNLENKISSDTLKSSASMYESSGSQIFRNTTRIQLRPGTFDKSRFVKIERDAPVIKIRVLRKDFSKQFCLIRWRRQHQPDVEERIFNGFNFVENSISNSPKVLRAKFPERGDRLVCFNSICRFKNPFAMITSLHEISFRLRRFIGWCKQKKGNFHEL